MSVAPDASPPPLVELNMAADQAHRGLRRRRPGNRQGAARREQFLEVQLAELRASVSAGYLRGRFYPARDRKD
jgi:hypothetical protein